MVSKSLERECIVVFDEAHNIDNVCIEALSVNLRQQTLDNAGRNLTRLSQLVDNAKQADAQRLTAEYNRLVQVIPRHLSRSVVEDTQRLVQLSVRVNERSKAILGQDG